MNTPQKQLNLAIVDDHKLFRKGLVKLINLADRENKYNVLFEAGNGAELIAELSKEDLPILPDIVLMDIEMPGMDGFGAVAWMKENHPEISILVITMFEEEEKTLKMLRLGVKGFLSKNIEVEDMYSALETIKNKGIYYSEAAFNVATKAMLGNVQNITAPEKTAGQVAELSKIDRTFLEYVCTELTYQQIADKMFLSPKTIDGYRDALFKRFDAKSRVGLALYAVKNGYVKI